MVVVPRFDGSFGELKFLEQTVKGGTLSPRISGFRN